MAASPSWFLWAGAGGVLGTEYGIGLAAGFLSYLVLVLVVRSGKFGAEWFLDGRRKELGEDEYIPEAPGERRPP